MVWTDLCLKLSHNIATYRKERAEKMKRYLMTLLLAITGMANAAPITFIGSGTGPGGVAVAASASFDMVGNTLTIRLSNISGSNSGTDVPGSTLSGLFWDFTGNPVLTPMSAMLAAGSSIIGPEKCTSGACVGVTNVSGEFGYAAAAFTGGADRGISSSGYLTTGLSGNPGNFNGGLAGADLDNPDSLDGINFGIISQATGFNPNGGLNNDPLISDTVVFILQGVAGLTNADIANVSFQYGTSITELNIPGGGGGGGGGTGNPVPEPGTLGLLGIGLLGLGLLRRGRRR